MIYTIDSYLFVFPHKWLLLKFNVDKYNKFHPWVDRPTGNPAISRWAYSVSEQWAMAPFSSFEGTTNRW